jgi:hypothetical protein
MSVPTIQVPSPKKVAMALGASELVGAWLEVVLSLGTGAWLVADG